MYSDELNNNKNKPVEIDLHPLSKWRRILVYLGDLMISFMVAVLIMNIAVMPLTSIIIKPDSEKAYEAEVIRDEILYENKLLFYKGEEGQYRKYYFDGNLIYTFKRFLAYYCFKQDEASLNPDYPEFSHLSENEIIYTYYSGIKSDNTTYISTFTNHDKDYGFFLISDSSISLKQEVIDEIKISFKPGESLGKKGQEIYDSLSDIFSAMYGVVMRDILENDLSDSAGHSFKDYQQIITQIANNYYKIISICALISFVIALLLVKLLYPLINKAGRTPTMSIMKVDRIGFKNLYPINKGEAALMSAYSLLSDLPYVVFLTLSYTTLIYIFRMTLLTSLTLISLLFVIVSLFVILFSPFNRSIIDVLSQTVLISSDEVDSVIRAKEELKELELAKIREEREKDNG